MKLHPTELAFLSALAQARDSWVTSANDAIADPSRAVPWSEVEESWAKLAARLTTPEQQEAFRAVVHELLSGIIHSALVVLDGGSSLAEATLLKIEDSKGHVLSKCLHESWPEVSGAPGV